MVALPRCAAVACRICDPWRLQHDQRRTLLDAVRVAEAMRAEGWVPHQVAEPWDRAELGASGDVPLLAAVGPVLAQRVDSLSVRAAAPQTLPLLPLPAGGVRIGATNVLAQPEPVPTTRTSPDNRAAMYSAIAADVASGGLERGRATVFGRLFLGPKDRPIYDPRHLNDAIPREVKSVAYGSIRDMASAGRIGAKLDLKAAFRSVPVHELDRPLLGVRVDGVTLRYAQLPFGLATSPTLFCGLLRESLAKVRVPPDHLVIDYVDDVAVTGPDAFSCASLLCDIIQRLLDDGWRVACSKIVARPTASFAFLGFAVDLPTRAVAITPQRLGKILGFLKDVLAGQRGWWRALETVLGIAAWASPALRGAGFVVPPLYRAFRTKVMDEEARTAVALLGDICRDALVPRPLVPPADVVNIVTDAGAGAWCAALCRGGSIVAVHRGPLPSEAGA